MAKSKHSKQELADSPVPGALSDAMTNFALSLIDHGLTAAAMHRILTNAFLQAAAKRARLKNGRVNQSRVAIMTGLTRTEVRKHFEHGDVKDPSTAEFGANRVVNSWMRDPEFSTNDGQPKELPLNGRYGSFKSLARLYSGDIPARATLEELKRLGVVRVTRGSVRLLRQSASGKRRQEKTLSAIGMQISDSLRAIGYPTNSAPTHVTTDSIILEAGDSIAAQLLRQRCLDAAKGMLAGLEVSSRNLPHEMKSRTRAAPGKIKVSVIISEST